MPSTPFIPSDPHGFALCWANLAGGLASHVVTTPDREAALALGRTLAEELDTEFGPAASELAVALALPRLTCENMNVGVATDVRNLLHWAGQTAVILLQAVAAMQPPPAPPAP